MAEGGGEGAGEGKLVRLWWQVAAKDAESRARQCLLVAFGTHEAREGLLHQVVGADRIVLGVNMTVYLASFGMAISS